MTDKSQHPATRAYNFSGEIIKLTSTFPSTRLYWVINDQILRSGMSIGANIVEAKYASTKKEFIRYYKIALKSAKETEYWLNILKDFTSCDKEESIKLISELKEIIKILASSIITMQKD